MADMTAGDVMVAAPRMDLLDIDAPYDELLHVVIDTGHSRFPVYEGERDNIIGILMAKDLLKLQRAPELNLRTLLRPAVFVPESKGLNELLRDFRSNRNHLAIVIDEFGNTAGLITIEDVLEEIVGEIEDEFDEQGRRERHLHAGRRQPARGRRRRHRARSTRPSALQLPEDEFDTIGGLVAHELGRVPRRGEAVDGRRPALHGDAHARRRGALVQGHARARSRRRRRRRRLMRRAPRWPLRRWTAGGWPRSGALQTLAYVHTAAWWLQLLLRRPCWPGGVDGAPRRAARRCSAGCSAPAWLAAGIWWLFISMHRYGGLPALAGGAGGAARWRPRCRSTCALAWRCSRAGAAAAAGADALLFAALWLLAELARGVLFTGFPVGRRRATRRSTAPLAAWRRGSASTASARWRRWSWRRWPALQPDRAPARACCAALAAAAGRAGRRRRWSAAPDFTRPHRHARASRCCRATSPQDEKFAAGAHAGGAGAGTATQLQRGARRPGGGARDRDPAAARAAGPTATWEALRAPLRAAAGSAALVGVPLGDDDERLHQLGGRPVGRPGSAPYRYDKQHLVPFGEFIPTGFRWFTELMNIPLGDFNRGAAGRAVVRRRRRARRAQHLLRRPVRRGTGARASPTPAQRADDACQPQQHRLVRRHHRHRPAPADLAPARAGVAAADAARHQHRRDRGRSTTAAAVHARAAAAHARRARRRGRRAATASRRLPGGLARFGLWPLCAAGASLVVVRPPPSAARAAAAP